MFDQFQVRALAGPLRDIQILVPKLLLHCLGCVLRVVALLEGEPSPQSEALRALEQVPRRDGARFSPDVTLGILAKAFNLGFIRRDNVVSHHGLRVL